MPKDSNTSTLQVTEGEARIAMKIVARFAKSLVFNPRSDERLRRVALACTPDAVVVREFGVASFGDHVNAHFEVYAHSGGKLESVTLPELHVLLFHEPRGEKAFEALTQAVLWERDRQRNGERPGVHEKEIAECLSVAAKCACDSIHLLLDAK